MKINKHNQKQEIDYDIDIITLERTDELKNNGNNMIKTNAHRGRNKLIEESREEKKIENIKEVNSSDKDMLE